MSRYPHYNGHALTEAPGFGVSVPPFSKANSRNLRQDSQQFILNNWESWYVTKNDIYPNKKEALKVYCELYNNRQIMLPESIYKKIKNIAVSSLYRWKKEIKKQNGHTLLPTVKLDINGILMPFNTSLNKTQIDFILQNYLHQGQPGIGTVHTLLKARNYLGGPTVDYMTLYRFVNNFVKYNYGLTVMAREGKNAFKNKCQGYIVRDWDLLAPDELWVADGHKIDVQVRTPDGKKISRPTAVVFMDMRSRYITGLSLHWTENTYCVLQSLSFGLLFNGTPDALLMDNGTSFKNHTMLGEELDSIKIAGVFKRLGIEPLFAIPGEPQSKPIERFFGTLKNNFSRFWKSYTGGAPQWRPEQNENLQLSDYPDIYELYINLLKYIHLYNTTHEHSGLNGKTPASVYQSVNHKLWKAKDLKPLMRPAFFRQIRRNGIKVKIHNEERWFFNREWVPRFAGNKVKYIVYINDYDLNSVDVHEPDGTYLFTAYSRGKIHPLTRNNEEFYEAQSAMIAENRHGLKEVKKQLKVIQEIDAGGYPDILENVHIPQLDAQVEHNWEIDEDESGLYLPNEHEMQTEAQDILIRNQKESKT